MKRYSRESLIEVLTDVVYNYIASGEPTYEKGKIVEDNSAENILHYLRNKRQEKVDFCREEVKIARADSKITADEVETMWLLAQEADEEEKLTFKEQLKDSSTTAKNLRSYFEFPLNKKINAYYDDLTLIVCMADDITILSSKKLDEYDSLLTLEGRIDFLKKNTLITHLAFSFTSKINWSSRTYYISILGNTIKEDEILDKIYCDFATLRLTDTVALKNNDLRQFFQSKIDLDKENMKVIDKQRIRGDVYTLLSSKYMGEECLYIRYTCPSTGRVYYNELDVRNLSASSLYSKQNIKSYLPAFWNIINLGADPYLKEDVIRC